MAMASSTPDRRLLACSLPQLSIRRLQPQSCVKTFLVSSENQTQNVPQSTPKMHYGAIFQPAIPATWRECFYTTLYNTPPKNGKYLPKRSARSKGPREGKRERERERESRERESLIKLPLFAVHFVLWGQSHGRTKCNIYCTR